VCSVQVTDSSVELLDLVMFHLWWVRDWVRDGVIVQ